MKCHYDKNWGLTGKIIYDYTKNIFLLLTGPSSTNLEMNGDVLPKSSKESIFILLGMVLCLNQNLSTLIKL
ncbi:MAG: hypothetical protein LBR15_09455 [Methanobrevibacter sp.]|jgi:hypothetical protein|nr:hypothetical protein [Candidatus Methanovirga australis]